MKVGYERFIEFEDEVFEPIELCYGRQLISNYGKVYHVKEDRLCKIHDNGAGYLSASLTMGGTALRYLHRLVAQQFIPNPEDKKYVNHIDHDKSNNSVHNLEWVTAKENTKAGIDAGRINAVKRGKTMRLTHQDRDDIVRLTVDGLGVNEIAVMLGFKRTTVSSVLNGRSGAKQVEWAFDHYRREKLKEINN